MDDLMQWLRAQLDEDIKNAYVFGTVISAGGIPAELDIPLEAAGRHARFAVEKAELKRAFFEETVVLYLGLEGSAGRIAERQARMIAAMYANRPGYREEWRP